MLKYKRPKFWIIVVSIIIVLAVGIGLTTNPKDKGIDKLDQITSIAWDAINRDIENLESNPEVKIIDSKITRLALVETFDELVEIPIDVYALEYRLLPEELSKVVLAGGMDVDENVWLKEKSSMGSPLLVVLRDDDSANLIGTLWSEEVSGELGLEPAIKSLIESIPLVPTVPGWSLEQNVGVDMVELDYASDDIVIFHDYFGMFVYDLNSLQIIRSIDLEPLNCHYTQGDNYCDVSVSMDGNTVQLHPMSSKNMFVYTVSDNTFQETTYKLMNDPFRSQFISIEEVINSKKFGNYSHHAVSFGTGEYGYLHTSDLTLGSLTYVRGDMVYALFNEKKSDKSNTLSDKITDWEPTTYEIVNNFDGVTMTIKEGTYSSNSLILVIKNNSSSQCIYGEHFWLEKKINGSWYQVPVVIDGDYGFNDIGYDLVSGEKGKWKVDWNWLYGNLDTGEYRIVKDMLEFRRTGDYDKNYLTAEFAID